MRSGFLTAVNACPGVNPAIPCTPIERAGQLRIGDGVRAMYKKNFHPRFSFALRPFANNKTSIRGGFGVFTITNLGQLSLNTTNINVRLFVPRRTRYSTECRSGSSWRLVCLTNR